MAGIFWQNSVLSGFSAIDLKKIDCRHSSKADRHRLGESALRQAGFDGLLDSNCRDAEMFIKFRERRAGAERIHAHENAVRPDDGVPALPDAGLDRHLDGRIADDRAALCVVLCKEGAANFFEWQWPEQFEC